MAGATRAIVKFTKLFRPSAIPTIHCRSVSSLSLNDGNVIPQVGLGTWKSPPGYVGAAVTAAVDSGYRHIDCALVYGNEDEIGAALQRNMTAKALQRSDLFLTGKLWNTFHSRAKAREGLHRSLKSLQTPYLDSLLIHYPFGFDETDEKDLYPADADGNLRFSDVDYLETYSAMESFVEEGIVRSIGVSNFNVSQLERLMRECSVTPATNQVEVHPYFANSELIQFCQSRGVVVTAYSPLGSPDRPGAKAGAPVLLEDPVVIEIASKLYRPPAQILIRFALQLGLVVIPKSVTPSRIELNLQVFNFELNEDDMEKLRRLDKGSVGRTCSPLASKNHPLWPFG